MQICSIRMDQFGDLKDLHLDHLDDRLQVLVGPSGTGKTTLRKFIDGVLHGMTRPGDGGSVQVRAADGYCSLRRSGNAVTGGRLQLQPLDSNHEAQARVAHEMDHVDPVIRQALYRVDFGNRASLRRLIDAVMRHVETVRPHIDPTHSARLARVREDFQRASDAVAALCQRRDDAAAELQRIARQHRERHEELAYHRQRMQHREGLQHELDEVERRIEELQGELARLNAAHHPAPQPTDSCNAVNQQIEALDQQVRRWKQVQRDLLRRSRELRDELLEGRMNGAADATANPRPALQSLEASIHALQHHAAHLNPEHCMCRDTRQQLEMLAQQMQASIYSVCHELSQQHAAVQQQALVQEARQLRRCRRELNGYLQRLAERRRALLNRFAELDPAGLELYHRQVVDDCGCDSHDDYLQGRRRDRPDEPTSSNERQLHAELERRVDALRHDREQIRRQLAELPPHTESAHGDLQRELQQAEQRLQRAQHELDRAEQLRETARQEVDALQRDQPLVREPSELLVSASEHLRRLSRGRYREVALDPHDHALWIDSSDGRQLPLELGPRAHDQLCLSLCLALVEHSARRGVILPLVLDDPFVNLRDDQLEPMVDVLVSAAGNGRQVIVMTGNTTAADLLHRHGAVVQELEHYPVQDTPVVQENSRPPSPSTYRSEYRLIERSWDDEEFPGELKDRVRVAEHRREVAAAAQRDWNSARRSSEVHRKTQPLRPAPTPVVEPAAPKFVAPTVTRTTIADPFEQVASPPVSLDERFHLETSSPIERSPSIGPQLAEQLRAIGVEQVSDLLGISPEAAAGQLSVPSQAIRDWQAQAWLVCCVPHLRGYDARILVASGITDPKQLEQLEPDELYQMVERFLATPEGERIVQAGTEYERSRIGGWIRAARQARRRQTAWQRQGGASAGAGIRSYYETDFAWKRRGRQPDPDVTGGTESSFETPSTGVPYPGIQPGNVTPFSSNQTNTPNSTEPASGTGNSNAYPNPWSSAGGSGNSGSGSSGNSGSGRGYGQGSPGGRTSGSSSNRSTGDRQRKSGSSSRSASSRGSGNSGRRRTAGTRSQSDREPTTRTPRIHREESESRASQRSSRSESSSSQTGSSTSSKGVKFYLDPSDPVVDAPTIGPRTAEHLNKIGITSVAELLAADPAEASARLNNRRVKPETVRQWQAEATLVCRIPQLRGHDAQMLVACGYRDPEQLARMDPHQVWAAIEPFSNSRAGARIIRSGRKPDLEEVRDWIRWAAQTRRLAA